AFAVAAKQETAPGIVARNVGLQGEKVLAEENVFVAVAVEVGDANGKGRRHLRFDRQWAGLEVIAAIEKEAGFEREGFERLHSRRAITEDFRESGFAKGGLRGEAFGEKAN